MALKVLGQSAPAATTLTDIYTVPALAETVVSTIAICNRSQGEVKMRIAVRPAGETIANKHYIAYDAPITGQDSTYVTIGATLAEGDVISVYSENTSLSFSVFGNEA